MARRASTYSRSRGVGEVHSVENRRVTWAFTCVPSPSTNRPPDRVARSQASWAVTIGDRGNATAMAVPRVRSGTEAAASARGRKGSWAVSAVKNPSNPSRAARAADSAAAVGGSGG